MQPPIFQRYITYEDDVHAATWHYHRWSDFKEAGQAGEGCAAQRHDAPPIDKEGPGWCGTTKDCTFCRMYFDTSQGTPQEKDLASALQMLQHHQRIWMGDRPLETVQKFFNWCANDQSQNPQRQKLGSWGYIFLRKENASIAAVGHGYQIHRVTIKLDTRDRPSFRYAITYRIYLLEKEKVTQVVEDWGVSLSAWGSKQPPNDDSIRKMLGALLSILTLGPFFPLD